MGLFPDIAGELLKLGGFESIEDAKGFAQRIERALHELQGMALVLEAVRLHLCEPDCDLVVREGGKLSYKHVAACRVSQRARATSLAEAAPAALVQLVAVPDAEDAEQQRERHEMAKADPTAFLGLVADHAQVCESCKVKMLEAQRLGQEVASHVLHGGR